MERCYSVHLRFRAPDTVVRLLTRFGVIAGAPIPVAPTRCLPRGIFISGCRAGWVSLWGGGEAPDWVAELSAELECPAVATTMHDDYYTMDFFQDSNFLGTIEGPESVVRHQIVRQLAGIDEEPDPDSPDVREMTPQEQGEALGRALGSEEYEAALVELYAAQPEMEALRAFVADPEGLSEAWEALVRPAPWPESVPDQIGPVFVDDYMETALAALGIQDASWDPDADAGAFLEGEYDEGDETLPEEWAEFRLLPINRLTVLI